MLLPLVLALAAASPSSRQAGERPYDVAHYRLELRFVEADAFSGTAELRLTPRRAVSSLELDASGLDVQAVELSGGPPTSFSLTPAAGGGPGGLTVRTPRPLPAGREVTLRIRYAGRAGRTDQEGPYRVELAGGTGPERYLFAGLAPAGASRLYPCNTRGSDVATSELLAVSGADERVVTGGRLLVDERFLEGGVPLRRVHWVQERPHRADQLALAVGPFARVDVGGERPAALYVPRGAADRTLFVKEATRSALTFLEDFLHTPLPWEAYTQVAVPRALAEASAGAALGLLREDALVLDGGKVDFAHRPEQLSGVARALAHQWLAAPPPVPSPAPSVASADAGRELDAALADYLASATVDAVLEGDLAEVQRAERALLSAPVGPHRARGELVLRMLEEWVGREGMRQGLASLLAHPPREGRTLASLVAAVGEATGRERELRGFASGGLTRRAAPALAPSTSWDGEALTVTLTLTPPPGEARAAPFKLPVVFHREGAPSYRVEQVLLVDAPLVRLRVPLPAAPQWVNWNRDGAALVRIAPEALAESQWTRALRHDPDPVWRLLAAAALLEGLDAPPTPEGGARLTGSARTAVVELLERDPSPAVREAVLRRLGQGGAARLPPELGPPLLALARSPEGLAEDAIGRVRVRREALAALGRVDHRPGRDLLLSHAAREELDVNTLEGLLTGVARLGDGEALASLRAAVFAQRRRGEARFRAAATALAAFPSADVVPVLREALAASEGDAALVAVLVPRLAHNPALLRSPELASLVADVALTPGAWGEDARTRLVGLLSGVRTPEARLALERVASGRAGDRLAASARQVLEQHAAPVRSRTTSSRP
jgi:hypothetical protein